MTSLPIGIIDRDSLFGDDDAETEQLRHSLDEHAAQGILEAFPPFEGADSNPRYFGLTDQGIRYALNYLGIPAPENQRNRVRGRWGKPTLMYRCYSAGTHTLLSSARILSAPELFKSRFDPFLLGYPETVGQTGPVISLYDYLRNYMLESVQAANQHMRKIGGHFGVCYFLPALLMPPHQADEHKVYSHTYAPSFADRNHANYEGVLIDSINHFAYPVFAAPRIIKEHYVEWYPKAYRAMMYANSTYMCKLHLQNEQYHLLQDCLILCRSREDAAALAAAHRKFKEPFAGVYPIVADQAGAAQLRMLGRQGIHVLEDAHCQAVLDQVPGSALRPGRRRALQLVYKGRPLHVGTTLNLSAIKYLLPDHLTDQGRPYVACYQWQRDIYRDTAQMDDDLMITIAA